MSEHIYDLIIIGGGPAGLSAGLYAGRSQLDTLIIEKGVVGGQISLTHEVANYPGSLLEPGEMVISGPDLVARMDEQAKHFGAKRIAKSIVDMDFTDKIKKVIALDGTVFLAKAVIIATGANSKRLGAPGEDELTGKGVSYCATCDGAFFSGLEVFAVGGGYTAVEEAMYLARFARKVTIIVRKDKVRCPQSILDRALANPKIEIKFNTEIKEIYGDGLVEGMKMYNNKTNEEYNYDADPEDGTFGIFMFVGYSPNTAIFKGHVEMDASDYIITDENLATNVPGVFAAGDLRPKLLRQVITATADGAIAATAAEKYLEENFHN